MEAANQSHPHSLANLKLLSRENKRSSNDDEYHVETFKVFFKGKSFREITRVLVEKEGTSTVSHEKGRAA